MRKAARWRGQRGYGLPEESVDWRKRRSLRAGFGRLMEAGRLPDGTLLPALPIRIDVVAVEPPLEPSGDVRLRHHRAAIGS